MEQSVTQRLKSWKLGEPQAENDLMREVYGRLRSLSQAQPSRMPEQTLQATELVHEAFERLHCQRELDWQDRSHFMAIAATVIRRVLVDHLRSRSREKRGGSMAAVTLGDTLRQGLAGHISDIDWLELDEAMCALERTDARAALAVELRVFGGLEIEEVATLLSSSTATASRQWRFARASLASHLSD